MARLDWTQLPPALRARVEEFAGSPVAWAQSQDGGFSAGLASRLTFADGRRLFVKAVQESAEGTFALYVREAEVLGAIPRSLPAAHLVDAFTADGWAVLLIEDVEGRHPERSATAPDTAHVLDAIAALATAEAPRTLPRLADELHDDSGSWRRLEEGGLLETTTPWCAQNVDLLRTAAERVGTAVAGDRLLHADLRAPARSPRLRRVDHAGPCRPPVRRGRRLVREVPSSRAGRDDDAPRLPAPGSGHRHRLDR